MGGRGSASGIKEDFRDWLKSESRDNNSTIQPMELKKFENYTLEQIERRIRNLRHEELFVINQDGKIEAAYKGNSSSVAFPDSLLKQKNVTVTHGHPKTRAEFGGTFSFADMANLLKSEWVEHRATASGQGEMNYIMRKTEKADAEGFYQQMNSDYVRLNSEMDEMWDNSFLEARKSGSTKKNAIHIARQRAVGVLNKYYKEMATKYGYEYITRKEEYHYGR